MNRIKRIQEKLNFLENYNSGAFIGVDSIERIEQKGRLKVYSYAPKESSLYQTIPHPTNAPAKILEYVIKVSKDLGDNTVSYNMELFRDGFDIGTYYIGLSINFNENMISWTDYKVNPFKFQEFMSWFHNLFHHEQMPEMDNNKWYSFKFILDDYAYLKKQDDLFVLKYSKSNNYSDIFLTYDEMDIIFNELNKLNSKVNINSSIYNFYRQDI